MVRPVPGIGFQYRPGVGMGPDKGDAGFMDQLVIIDTGMTSSMPPIIDLFDN
jgi:hypothetical protein